MEELIVGEGYDSDKAAAGLSTLLSLPEPPTAVFAANDEMANGVLQEAKRQGISVPEKLAVVGYGDLDIAQGLGLTTVTQNPQQMGHLATIRLWERMQNITRPPQLTTTPTELIVRHTSCVAYS